ncbi:MAG TPA: AN1-type zinc finger domain-containing protein [Methanoregula sp.]|nr:AN1-type zinc finger domain-containing protein [Methanoregula sp.]
MPRCDYCGAECALPFTCQHCGGKFCPGCRLPPGHQCAGLASWKKKPAPGVGLKYGRGGGVTATGGGYIPGRQAGTRKKTGAGIPWLKIMIAAIAIILLGIGYIVLSSPAR